MRPFEGETVLNQLSLKDTHVCISDIIIITVIYTLHGYNPNR